MGESNNTRELLATPSPWRAAQAYAEWDREYKRLAAKSAKASEARAALPPGSPRARVTSANARWMRASEARDRRGVECAAEYEAQRQPWQMTRAEWAREMDSGRPDPAGATCSGVRTDRSGRWLEALNARQAFLRYYLVGGERSVTHRDVIAQALAEGRPVPEGVRAEYAELATRAA